MGSDPQSHSSGTQTLANLCVRASLSKHLLHLLCLKGQRICAGWCPGGMEHSGYQIKTPKIIKRAPNFPPLHQYSAGKCFLGSPTGQGSAGRGWMLGEAGSLPRLCLSAAGFCQCLVGPGSSLNPWPQDTTRAASAHPGAQGTKLTPWVSLHNCWRSTADTLAFFSLVRMAGSSKDNIKCPKEPQPPAPQELPPQDSDPLSTKRNTQKRHFFLWKSCPTKQLNQHPASCQ